jgi:N-acetylglucosaminyldiphosphoundecaprenol N-acetyl-beta-D-mannosaminyltransferase
LKKTDLNTEICGIKIDIQNVEELHALVKQTIAASGKLQILNANAHLINLTINNERIKSIFQSEKVRTFCDGAGIKLAAKITKQQVPDKITYNKWFFEFSYFCQKNDYSVFMLGGQEGVSQKAKNKLLELYPNLNLFEHHGYFNKSGCENEKIIELINSKRPNILLVCFGMPLQEYWIENNYDKLNCNIFLTGGAALDYISGNARVTPRIFDKLYMEWLFRLMSDPKRLFKRYVIGNFKFVFSVIKSHFHEKNN